VELGSSATKQMGLFQQAVSFLTILTFPARRPLRARYFRASAQTPGPILSPFRDSENEKRQLKGHS
jgi:hypothetical protein